MLDLIQVEQTTDISVLVDEFIQHCYANDQSEWTIRTRRTHLKHLSEFCKVAGIDITELNNVTMDRYFLEYIKGFPSYRRPRTKSTVNASRRIIKVFLRWIEGYKEMQVRANPDVIKYVREPNKLPKYIDRSIVLEAIDTADCEYDSLMIEVMWRAGLRISELVVIRERDIRDDEISIQGKGANERRVYITDHLAKRLADVRTGDPDRLVFRNSKKNNEAIGLNAARLHIQRVFSRIDVKMHPHQLRHSFAVELLTQGCDIVSIQKMMGHEDITTTQVYLRLFDDQVKKQYKKFMV